MDTSETVTLLVLSDLHKSNDNVSRVQKWLETRRLQPDWLVLCGDFQNLSEEDRLNPELMSRELRSVKKLISQCAALVQCGHAVMVAGNHDSPELISDPMVAGVRNLHASWMTIGDSQSQSSLIEFGGFSGAVPGLFDDGSEVWEGHPWKSDREYTNCFKSFWDSRNNQKQELNNGTLGKPDNLMRILVSHIGPFSSQTSIDQIAESQDILAGSQALDELSDVDMIIHGHVHRASGMTRMRGGITVINPGALQEGRFALITLFRSSQVSRWELSGVQFVRLPQSRL